MTLDWVFGRILTCIFGSKAYERLRNSALNLPDVLPFLISSNG